MKANAQAEIEYRMHRAANLKAVADRVVAERLINGDKLIERCQAETGSVYLRFELATPIVRRARVSAKTRWQAEQIWKTQKNVAKISYGVYEIDQTLTWWGVRVSDHDGPSWRSDGIHQEIRG